MYTVLTLLLLMAPSEEKLENDLRKELSTAIPHFAKLLEDGKVEEFIDTAIYALRLKSVLKQTTRERLIEGYRDKEGDFPEVAGNTEHETEARAFGSVA